MMLLLQTIGQEAHDVKIQLRRQLGLRFIEAIQSGHIDEQDFCRRQRFQG